MSAKRKVKPLDVKEMNRVFRLATTGKKPDLIYVTNETLARHGIKVKAK